MKIRTSINFDSGRLAKSARAGALNALTRSAAYLRGVIKRSIRKRKNATSRPGQPPFDHGTFAQSMRFSVDKENLLAYVGPARLLSKMNAMDGQPAPETLEFGGRTVIHARNWFTSKPPKMTTFEQIVNYFQALGYGPIIFGNTPDMVMDQAQDNHWSDPSKSKQTSYKKIRGRDLPNGDRIYYLSLPIKSTKMAARAARGVIARWGYPITPNVMVRPRPYLQPGLEKVRSQLPAFFKNAL